MELESKLVLLEAGGCTADEARLLAARQWRPGARLPAQTAPRLAERLRASGRRAPSPGLRAFAERSDTFVISADEPVYPPLLAEIPDPPGVLMLRGSPAAAVSGGVAVVGSRRATPNGVRLAERLGRALGEAGVAVISGLAYGIDVAAHRGVLAAGGVGVAVMGCGLASVYPHAHTDVAARLLHRGAWLCELPPSAPPARSHFPRRNRIVSGLARAVVVVEAAERSGSLITARLALEQNREVFAVPGSVFSPVSRGCHRLLRDGAALLEGPEDLIDVLPGLAAGEARADRAERVPEGEDGRAALLALGYDAETFETLARRLAWPALRLRAALTELELDGFVRHVDGRYIRGSG